MEDLSKINAICRLAVGRELAFPADIVNPEVDRRRLRRACDRVTRRTGAIFEVRKTARGHIVRRIAADADRGGRDASEREAKTWLLPERLYGCTPHERAFRIGRAFCCLQRVAKITGEKVEEVSTRLGLNNMVLLEDARFGEWDVARFAKLEGRSR